ncbi:19650_t:CDS:2, partial [Gigaspora rosea]
MNNSSSFSSFKKNSLQTSKSLPGARLSPYNGQLLLSTGVPSLDDILTFQCGGLPVGTILLIKEDKHTGYSKLLVKYFLSQGIASGHHVLFSSAEDPSNFIKGLPWITSNDSNDPDEKAEVDDKMKIAWRYKEMKKFESGIKTTPTNFKHKQVPIAGSLRQEQPFCYTFDLTKSIPQPSIDSASITL